MELHFARSESPVVNLSVWWERGTRGNNTTDKHHALEILDLRSKSRTLLKSHFNIRFPRTDQGKLLKNNMQPPNFCPHAL
jgi:hypothetical protein